LQNSVAQAADQALILNRKQNLHPAIQISRHQVGAARVDKLVATVVEVVNAAVFQKTSKNASDANGFAYSGNARAQGTDAPDDEINFYARLRCFIKQPYHTGIFQRVHFKNKMPIAMLLMALDLGSYQALQTRPDTEWRNQQLAIGLLSRIAGQVIEQVADVLANFFIRGEQ